MFESIHFTSKGRAVTSASKPEVIGKLRSIVGEENVVVDPDKVEPYGADAVKEKFPPEAVVFPESTAQMSAILELANEYLFPVTARGGGVGYTGGAVPVDGGIVIGTDRMNRIIEISVDDLYAVCQPGIRTFELQQAVEKQGLMYFVPKLSDLTDLDVLSVGGGDSAFDWALALQPIAKSVTLVHRRDRFRAHPGTVDRVRALPVRILVNAQVTALRGSERVTAAH